MAPDKHRIVVPFCCPVCERSVYEPVMGMHAGKSFHAGIYRCVTCGFGFVDPTRYAPGGQSEVEITSRL